MCFAVRPGSLPWLCLGSVLGERLVCCFDVESLYLWEQIPGCGSGQELELGLANCSISFPQTENDRQLEHLHVELRPCCCSSSEMKESAPSLLHTDGKTGPQLTFVSATSGTVSRDSLSSKRNNS